MQRHAMSKMRTQCEYGILKGYNPEGRRSIAPQIRVHAALPEYKNNTLLFNHHDQKTLAWNNKLDFYSASVQVQAFSFYHWEQ